MTWMNKAAGHFPLYLNGARGGRVTDIDGHDYVDFALGDTGAMAGHSPEPVVAAIQSRVQEHGGLTAMMPTDAWVGAELERRFGVSRWSFTLTARDANRWAIRLARQGAVARPRRRRSGADGARADEHRDRPATAGLPRDRARVRP
jgi:glutamate-1-semialdehyde 2,1-aminomutase